MIYGQLILLFGVYTIASGYMQRFKNGAIREIEQMLLLVPMLLCLLWLGYIDDTVIGFWVIGYLCVAVFVTGGLTNERIFITTKSWQTLPETLIAALTAQGISCKSQPLVNSESKFSQKLYMENHKAIITLTSSRSFLTRIWTFTLNVKNGRGEKDVKEAVRQMIQTNQNSFPYTGSFKEYSFYIVGTGIILYGVFSMMW